MPPKPSANPPSREPPVIPLTNMTKAPAIAATSENVTATCQSVMKGALAWRREGEDGRQIRRIDTSSSCQEFDKLPPAPGSARARYLVLKRIAVFVPSASTSLTYNGSPCGSSEASATIKASHRP